ncbi:hypothetical protein NDU88_002850 [Pleurodeles waltl]|uniref:Uncharacterized protein n=1 Tax=Pleurodeles waltl TaxID=8319 RepID=A0AAV7UZS0_PLEWA|nr:hypothetical protein NDU88_002850 [Pleurodeles waltl]
MAGSLQLTVKVENGRPEIVVTTNILNIEELFPLFSSRVINGINSTRDAADTESSLVNDRADQILSEDLMALMDNNSEGRNNAPNLSGATAPWIVLAAMHTPEKHQNLSAVDGTTESEPSPALQQILQEILREMKEM